MKVMRLAGLNRLKQRRSPQNRQICACQHHLQLFGLLAQKIAMLRLPCGILQGGAANIQRNRTHRPWPNALL